MPYTFRHGDRPLEGVTVQRAVGRGGFGEVYYALTDSGKQVALKYLRENPEIELRGIAQVMNLKSPHLITIYDVRRNTAGEPFVLMEYVSGPSLRELLTDAPHGLGPQKAAYFIDGIAKGLAYLHDRGIVHRDLKPANIFYDDGYVKIGDYGLSKHISVSRHSGQTVSVGTVHYMAPEIGSGSYTKAIDIYAMGVILFEMLTGRLPFSGSSMGEILMRHLSDRPDLAGIPEPFAAVIAKALAKDPRDRYQDASEMAGALRQFADVTASIASFDHSVLNSVPRRADANDADQTMTTPYRVPPPPPPPLDAWGPPGRVDVLSDKLQKKKDKVSEKFRRKAEKLARKAGKSGERIEFETPEAEPAVDAAPRKVNRIGQLFVILTLMAGVAVGLSAIRGGPRWEEIAVGLFCCIAAAVAGPLVVYYRVLRRSPVRGGVWDRLAYVALTGVMLIPAFAMASDYLHVAAHHRGEVSPDAHFMRLLAAPLAMLLFCDWTRRLRTGQLGEVRAKDAAWPAVVGLIAASIAGADSFHLAAAVICATASLLTQAGAALWPVRQGVGGTPQAQPPTEELEQKPWAPLAGGTMPPTWARTAPAAATDITPPAVLEADNVLIPETGVSLGGSQERRTVGMAYLLWALCLFGVAGIHRFYSGRYVSGAIWVLTWGLVGIGSLVDLFLIPEMVRASNRAPAGSGRRPSVPRARPISTEVGRPVRTEYVAASRNDWPTVLLLLGGVGLALGLGRPMQTMEEIPSLAAFWNALNEPGHVALMIICLGGLLLAIGRRPAGAAHACRAILACLFSVAGAAAGMVLLPQISFGPDALPALGLIVSPLLVGLCLLLWPPQRERLIVI